MSYPYHLITAIGSPLAQRNTFLSSAESAKISFDHTNFLSSSLRSFFIISAIRMFVFSLPKNTMLPCLSFVYYLVLSNPSSEQIFLEILLIYEVYFKTGTTLSLICLLTFGKSSLQCMQCCFTVKTVFCSSGCRCCGNRQVTVVLKIHICWLYVLLSQPILSVVLRITLWAF